MKINKLYEKNVSQRMHYFEPVATKWHNAYNKHSTHRAYVAYLFNVF